jgi:phage-related protein
LKLGKSLVMALGSAAVVKGVTDFFKTSLDLGGELQQNLGGTEAVFGNFAKDIQTKASDAYMNMGMSASDYMATANKMASLFQGSGIEQEKSMNMTADAMQRAADVASVMGIDTQQAMDSIAGMAKGNFTMMDNLGVAMNATTLQAYALEKGVNFKWDTASNAEKAELAMQMFMERTSQYQGNFARESSETLSGSMNAVKASFSDFMATLAIVGDITGPMSNLVNSASTFLFENLLPAVGNIVSQLPSAIGTALDVGLPLILEQGSKLLETLGSGLEAGFPMILEKGGMILSSIVSGLTQNLPTLMSKGADMLVLFGQTIVAHLPEILQQGIALIGAIIQGVAQSVPKLMAEWPKIITGIKQAFTSINWAEIGTNVLKGIANGISSGVSWVLNAIKGVASKMIDGFKSFFKIGSPSKLMAQDVGRWIPAGIAKGMTDNISIVRRAMQEVNDSMIGSTALSARFNPAETYSVGEDIAQSLARLNRDSNVAVNVTLAGDTAKIFKVVEQQNTKRTKATQYNALAYR